jgi:imidazole glycerol-phosphate synthase subunit HisF
MKKSMHSGAAKETYQRARELRNNATHAEELLWGYLKAKPLGCKFRRQRPYAHYILDFYCHRKKLVIEVDGDIHAREEVKVLDQFRQVQLEVDGLKVIRFTNEQIKLGIESVIRTIEKELL